MPAPSDDGAAAGRSATQPEERKTETTLTTRIRINIPGSRPIPPVVVRKTVAEGGEAEQSGSGTGTAKRSAGTGDRPAVHGGRPGDGGDVTGLAGSARDGGPRRDDARGDVRPAGGAPAPSGGGSAPSGAESAAPAEEKATSDWFAPRKSSAGKGGQGGGATNGAGIPGGSGAGGASVNGAGSSRGSGTGPSASGPSGTGPSGAASSGVNGSGGTRPGAASRPGGVVGSMRAPGGASRPGGKGSALPGATGGPVAPGHGGGTGSFDVTEALAAGPLSGGSRPDGEPRRDDLPFFTGNGQGGQGGPEGPGGPGGFDGAGVPGGPGGLGGSPGPAGPTGGPVTGDGPLLPDGGTPAGVPRTPAAPGAPTAHPGSAHPGSAHPGSALPGGGLSDDTAILTPQKPAPEPGAGGHAHRPDNVSGHTVTSGMPVVSPGSGSGSGAGGQADSPFRPVAGGPRTGSSTPPASSEPGQQSTGSPGKSAKAAKAPKKKGRSKVALLGGLVVVAAGVAYGAGLLMNHSDVPKGTTVLGVDIGGGSRDDAVKKLDDAFGKYEKQPLKLSVDGRTVSLRPDQAGLQLDTQATASAAARSDYNPVSVIGSLFGNHRVVEPQMPVDEEKLQAALQSAAGGAGSATDGTIRFEPGKAVAVYGKAGKGIDAARSVQAVEQAYRTQVETGRAAPVQVPTTTRQPTVSDAEVDRMMKQFAEPAMSAKVTVRADAAHGLPMSPQKSLWKFLGVKAVDGKLVEYYDQEKLKQLYGGVFDGVLITRGNGQKTPVTVQDVIAALRPALVSKTNRVGIIDTNPD